MANLSTYDGFKNDVFSLGVTLFAMVLGYCPFERTSSNDRMYRYFQDNMEVKFWEKV
jgi:serine/threonine protein kinase